MSAASAVMRRVSTFRCSWSDWKAQRRAACGPALSRLSPELQFFRLHPKRCMGCGDDEPAAREVVTHQTRKQALSAAMERGGRLVEQPDRPPHREQPGERKPPALAGRQIRRRQMRGMIEPHRSKGLRCVERLPAEKIPPEREILHHA